MHSPSYLLLCTLGLTACEPQVAVRTMKLFSSEAELDLGDQRYDQEEQPSVTFSLTNVGRDGVLLTEAQVSVSSKQRAMGQAPDLFQVTDFAAGPLWPGQTTGLQVVVTADPLRWSTGDWQATLSIQARPRRDVEWDAVAQDTWGARQVALEIPLRVELDCDLDDDDHDALACSGSDCDDHDAGVYPDAPEACDGVDNDCDGLLDDQDPDDLDESGHWYVDGDGDGFGPDDSLVLTCAPAPELVAEGGDCDDGDSAVSPAAQEWCNGLDDDCDGQVDDNAQDAYTWHPDEDGDGYGSMMLELISCESEAPEGYVADGSDCNDYLALVYPGAIEWCDDLDNDCDGVRDDNIATEGPPWYADDDGDGFGTTESELRACEAPSGWVDAPGDCDDTDPTINPAAFDFCGRMGDGVDNDCDGLVDERDLYVMYRDDDGDGFGVAEDTLEACSVPRGYTPESGDCDDENPTIHPGATERCNAVDQDCDGITNCFLLKKATTLWGAKDGHEAGWALCGAGDVDGDGWTDLLVGAPGYGRWGVDKGAAYLLLGPISNSLSLADATGWVEGANANDRLGHSLAGGVDLDGDGPTTSSWGSRKTTTAPRTPALSTCSAPSRRGLSSPPMPRPPSWAPRPLTAPVGPSRCWETTTGMGGRTWPWVPLELTTAPARCSPCPGRCRAG